MHWLSPRQALLICAGLDLLGFVALLALREGLGKLQLAGQGGWIGAMGLGWLFGTYTLLSWRRIPAAATLRRQGTVVLVLQLLVALGRWVGVRLALWRGALLPEEPRVLLVAPEREAQQLLAEWRRTQCRLQPRWLPTHEALAQPGPVVSPAFQRQPEAQEWLAGLVRCGSCLFGLTTAVGLAEHPLEGLQLEHLLSSAAITWNDPLGVQRQLKRVADVPEVGGLLLLAALLIRLDDRGSRFSRGGRDWMSCTSCSMCCGAR